MKFVPKIFSKLGMIQPKYYSCTCEACGFTQKYETGDVTTIIAEDGEDDATYVHVEKVPTTCPKCGTKLTQKLLPIVMKY